jgi:hypothetical protein
MKSIFVNWHDNNIRDDWDFVGAEIVYYRESLRLKRCPHGNRNLGYCQECDCYPEERRRVKLPMVNFAYPLASEPGEDTIYRICSETNCTVVRHLVSGNYFLALNGSGMNLSQDIALAYIIADGCIEQDMLDDVYVSGAFSVTAENYRLILTQLERQLTASIDRRAAKLQKVLEQLHNV